MKFKVLCTPLSGVMHMGCTLCHVILWLYCMFPCFDTVKTKGTQTLLNVSMNIYFTNDNTTVINLCRLSLEFYSNIHIDLLLKITILNEENV